MLYLTKTIKIIAIVIALFFAYFVAINWNDEELRSEVAQALAWQPPVNAFEDNGYLTLLGIEAPTEMDAATVGKKALNAELARFADMQKTHKENLAQAPNPAEVDEYIDWKDNRCNYVMQANCVDFYLQQGAAKLDIVLLSQKRLTAHYNAIRQAKSYVEVMPPMITSQIPKYQLLTSASELERIRAIIDMADNRMDIGLQGYVNNAMFSRKLLRESNSLISHMIAISMMQRDIRLLSELMTKYPSIATKYSDQLMPMLETVSTPEYNLVKSFKNERDMSLQVMGNLKYATAKDVSNSSSLIKNNLISISTLGFQPNATTNLFYDWGTSRLELAQAKASQLDEVKEKSRTKHKDLLGLGYGWFFIENPVGKILASIAEPDYANYIERQHDLDGYLKMVKMQLDVLADGAGKNKTSGIKVHDPYTQKLMQYDVDTGVLTFEGRQPSSGNFNKSNIYQVKLH